MWLRGVHNHNHHRECDFPFHPGQVLSLLADKRDWVKVAKIWGKEFFVHVNTLYSTSTYIQDMEIGVLGWK